jgi:hypothetical protein
MNFFSGANHNPCAKTLSRDHHTTVVHYRAGFRIAFKTGQDCSFKIKNVILSNYLHSGREIQLLQISTYYVKRDMYKVQCGIWRFSDSAD